jgi:hypothetical protein
MNAMNEIKLLKFKSDALSIIGYAVGIINGLKYHIEDESTQLKIDKLLTEIQDKTDKFLEKEFT